MPFPGAGLLDDFNRANGALGANYGVLNSADGVFTILSSELANQTGGWANNVWASAFPEDQEIRAIVRAVSSGQGALYVRVRGDGGSGTQDSYALVHTRTSTFELAKTTDNIWTTMGASFTQTLSVGDEIGLKVYGNTTTTVEAWYKASGGSWTLLASRTDVTGPWTGSSKIGFESNGAWRFDDLYGGASIVYQQARPDGDLAAGGWTPSAGSTLWEAVDEASADGVTISATAS